MFCCYFPFYLEAILHLSNWYNQNIFFFKRKEIVFIFQLFILHMDQEILPLIFWTMKSQKRLQYELVKLEQRPPEVIWEESHGEASKVSSFLEASCSIFTSEVHQRTRCFAGINTSRVKTKKQKNTLISTSSIYTHVNLGRCLILN